MDVDQIGQKVKYAIKYSIPAHTGDVRAVAAIQHPENYIVTGSRDTLVKLWAPNTEGVYEEANVFCGATKYVSCLCVLPASHEYPEGLILAGSSDCAIYGFAVNHSEPVMKLLAHSDNVCCLSAGPFGTFVSGSWDKTARVWSGQQCHIVLTGHMESVWAAEFLPEPNLVLTASADFDIRLWRSGKCEKVYKGHTDCVRGLAILRRDHFLSCSNDCTVRLWSTAGDLLATYESHTAYIYSITLLRSGADFATCGEDSKVKIWRDGDCIQTLYFTGKTLWSIACTANGNLAVGCSDGTLFILGEVPMDEEVPEEIYERPIHEITDEFDDAESILSKEGEHDGETRFVFEQGNNCMVVYTWDAQSKQWEKKDFASEGMIGDIGKLPESNTDRVKTMSFNVDVEGVMHQIVYKMGEEPWEVAQRFVAEHNLPIDHVQTVASFILDNTGDGAFSEFDIVQNEKFITYDIVNVEGLTAKLTEFNSKVKKVHQLSEEQLKQLLVLLTLPNKVSEEQMSALETALMWEEEFLFPVLDLLRVAIKCAGMYSKVSNPTFINHLLQVLTETKFWMNRNLIIKIFCNMFGYREGKLTVQKFNERIMSSVGNVLQKGDTRTEKAGSALFLNFSTLLSEFGMSCNVKLCCDSVVEFITKISDFETIYRVLIVIASMMDYDKDTIKIFEAPIVVGALFNFQDLRIPKTQELLKVILMRIENFDDHSDDDKPSTSST
ncbi:phospholipase A-2-activating protein-like [Uloborus diversus]|uniref:phospholipase A-2-activating protein-like n=1 Tax=Uloborus diversus TaxID=327109 RepID=UPI002409D350|nr:phospholipase A-2-activating protein-like [Uloborus diversus]